MPKLSALALTLTLGLLYLLLAPLTSSAVVVFPVAAYYLRRHQSQGATLVLLLGSALADLTLPQAAPHYLLVSLVAGALYLELIEPHLAPNSALSSLLGLLAWLISWRLVYLAYLSAELWLTQSASLHFRSLTWPSLVWLGAGLSTWALLLGAQRLARYLKQRFQVTRRYA